MTPEITLRTFSDDQFMLDKIFYSNFYRLKGFPKEESSVIVDIGAHCGFFSFSALALGAKKVYAFEPFVDNYRMLLKNIEAGKALGVVNPHQVGVYVTSSNIKFFYPKLTKEKIFNFSEIQIDQKEGDYHTAPCLSLDEILVDYVKEDKVDLLKINIGYAENNILQASNLLARRVNNICGEVTLNESEILTFKESMEKKGFKDSYFGRGQKEVDKFVFIMSKDKCDKYFNVDFTKK